jgi:Tol biopolymer transport system component
MMFRLNMVLATVTVILVLGEGREEQPGRTVLRQGWREAPPNSPSTTVSGDGRSVAFVSSARLLPVDTNDLDDIYIFERASRRLTLATPPYPGAVSDGTALNPQLNADGRYLVFNSLATVLTAAPDRNEADDVFVRDCTTGVITRVSVGPGGQEANGGSGHPAISGNGRRVVFESTATNLVADGDANGSGHDVYLADLDTATLTRIGVDEAGRQLGRSFAPRISGDGRFVAFAASAGQSDPSRADPASIPRVYLRDISAGRTVCVSCDGPGRLGAFAPDLSADGGVVAFAIQSTPARSDIALYDQTSETIRVITRSGNAQSTNPRLSGDGRVVVFESWASNLLCGKRCREADLDENLLPDVYLFDRTTGRFRRASGAAAQWWTPSRGPGIDRTGGVVIFSSREPFGPEDLTSDFDLFVCSPVCL